MKPLYTELATGIATALAVGVAAGALWGWIGTGLTVLVWPCFTAWILTLGFLSYEVGKRPAPLQR